MMKFLFCFMLLCSSISIFAQDANVEETILAADLSPMTDSKVDNIVYYKKNGKYYKRNTDSGYNVKWFGAVGNGIVDDASAIQKALEYIKKSSPLQNITNGWNYGGGKLYLPAGKYKISKKILIPDNITIEGAGTNYTLIISQVPTAFSNVTGIQNGKDYIMSQSINIKKLFVNGGGIELIGAYDSTVESVKVFNTELGIDVSSAINLKIRDVQVLNCKKGIVLRGDLGSGPSTSTYLDNVWVAHCSVVGLSITAENYKLVTHSIRNSIFEYNGLGVQITGDVEQILFDNIHLEGNKDKNFRISNNVQGSFKNVWTDSSETYISGSKSTASKLYFENFNDQITVDPSFQGEIIGNLFVKKVNVSKNIKFKVLN
ncbi:Pectate lyase superfamily protein [Soonwooa buanensis]|uniref:Pectate lyase superfamily protein n=1 Tax=Soonwooa buanensis TaxID=619805 RepID=A0A1T5EV35_9FLAO|nr:glycosyl hydrolase family 28-related protein [Soonwooa buanensis]SKB87580.1 Pectate lyase superfamily protein [Soonwooa buanensis]